MENKNVGVLLMIIIGSACMLFVATSLMVITGKNPPAIFLVAAMVLTLALYFGVLNYLRTHGVMKLLHILIFDAFIGVSLGIFMYVVGVVFGLTGSTTGLDMGTDLDLNPGAIVFGFGIAFAVMVYYRVRKATLLKGPLIKSKPK